MSRSSPSSLAVFLLIFIAILLLHFPLLRLPFFWDEAGYYVPAARDLLTGSLIPHSTPSNAHPPLVMAYLAAWWKVFGFSVVMTRIAMLAVAAFSLLGVFRLSRKVANLQVALGATACTALYPVFFSQSTMAHVDLAAAGLTFWALEAYLGKRWRSAAIWFSLAALAKETAVLAPIALLGWEVILRLPFRPLKQLFASWGTASLGRYPGTNLDASAAPSAKESTSVPSPSPLNAREQRPVTATSHGFAVFAALALPLVILTLWYVYHYWRTGYVFGNPEFFRYNVQATMSGVRILIALLMRLWQAFGYMHLWVLMLLMMWAMTRKALPQRSRISVPVQVIFAIVLLTFVVALAVVGGAVLARYMLTVVPLVILVAVSTLWRRFQNWSWLVGLVCIAFVMALFFNPPYGFSFEDNLAYRDYVLMHQDAESFLDQRYPQGRVLTAWPASDELTQPYLGYVKRPLQVVRIENFSLDEVAGAAQERSRFDVALVFSTKYQPPHPLVERWRGWENLKTRFFGYHRDVPPAVAAQILGGRIVFTEKSTGQWVAVIEIERTYEARAGSPEP
jgi:hypothetical protein